jgi:hypothetical protein
VKNEEEATNMGITQEERQEMSTEQIMKEKAHKLGTEVGNWAFRWSEEADKVGIAYQALEAILDMTDHEGVVACAKSAMFKLENYERYEDDVLEELARKNAEKADEAK